MPSQSKSNIYFFFETKVNLKNRIALKEFIRSIFKREGRKFSSLNYIFCTDNQLLKINRQFLQHDFYTDIISFELSNKQESLKGEVYISVDRVKENATYHSEPFQRELHRVLFHGALHFCGYKDKTKTDASIMRKREDKYLKEYL